MARLFADENFPFPSVVTLRGLGHDVRTLQEAGYGGRAVPDEAVLSLGSDDGRAVLTINRRHFIRLHTQRPDHAGIIVCSFDPDFDALGARIHFAIEAEGPLTGRLLRIQRPAN
jgi:hypothetical protein